MARKLTKEELERYKSDFDPPIQQKAQKKESKKKPTKTEKEPTVKELAAAEKAIIEEEKKAAKMPKHPGGRPGAFREVQSLTLKLPPADITKLKVMAAQQNKTAAQVIHDLLN